MRDVARKIDVATQSDATEGERLQSQFARLLDINGRVHSQRRIRAEGDVPKNYSVHAPEVACFAKGKAQKKYEFDDKDSEPVISRFR